MLDISRIASLAKVFLPNNSPWIDKINQAEQMAKQFAPTKDGIAQLMAQHGKTKKDLQQAINMLNNPIIQNTLGRVPGLSNTIQNATNELVNDSSFGNPDNVENNQSVHNPQTSENTDSLFARLRKLK